MKKFLWILILFISLSLNTDVWAQRIGEKEIFKVKKFDSSSEFRYSHKNVTGELLQIGNYCFIYVEESLKNSISLTKLQQIREEFDNHIYPTIRRNFGEEWSLGTDGKRQIYIVLTNIEDDYNGSTVTTYTKGYFDPLNELREAQWNTAYSTTGIYTKIRSVTSSKNMLFLENVSGIESGNYLQIADSSDYSSQSVGQVSAVYPSTNLVVFTEDIVNFKRFGTGDIVRNPIFYPTNEKEVIFVDINPTEVGSKEFYATISREFFKMVLWSKKSLGKGLSGLGNEIINNYESLWIEKGLADLSAFICGYGHPIAVSYFRAYPDSLIFEDNPDYFTEINQGGSYLYFLYLYELFGDRSLWNLTNTQLFGESLVADYLKRENLTIKYLDKEEKPFDFTESAHMFHLASYLTKYSVDTSEFYSLKRGGVSIEKNDFFEYKSIEPNLYPTSVHSDFPLTLTGESIYYSGADYRQFILEPRGSYNLRVICDTAQKIAGSVIYIRSGLFYGYKRIEFSTGGIGEVAFNNSETGSYDSVILILGNYGDAENNLFDTINYDIQMIKGGPKLYGYFHPGINKNLVIVSKAGSLPSVSAIQTGMEDYKGVEINKANTQKSYYTGSYFVDPTLEGAGHILIKGVDTTGVYGVDRLYFNVSRFRNSRREPVISPEGELIINFSDSTKEDIVLLQKQSFEENGIDGFVYHLSQKINLSAFYSKGENKKGIYIKKQDGFIYIGKPGEELLSGCEVDSLYVLRDVESPVIETENTNDGIYVYLREDLSGIDPESVKVEIEKRNIPFEWKVPLREFFIKSDGDLKGKIIINVSDNMGNKVQKELAKVYINSIEEISCIAYPVPAKTEMTFDIRNVNTLENNLSLTLYRTDGSVLRTYFNDDFIRIINNYKLIWDLKDSYGNNVANSAYFYKLQGVYDGSKKISKGKIAVLR